METITKYKAYDGSEFTSEKDCIEYEDKCNKVLDAMRDFPERPHDDGCSFSNGGGYLQHDPSTFMNTRLKLLEIADEQIGHKWFSQSIEKGLDAHASYAGRIISECGTRELNNAWYRISCTDKNFREWGHPYYVEHPDEGDNICLNKDSGV